MPLYKVTHTVAPLVRIIDASSKTAAATYAAKTFHAVEKLTAAEAIKLANQGVKVEGENVVAEPEKDPRQTDLVGE